MKQIVTNEPIALADYTHAIENLLEDFGAERDRITDTKSALLNILEDSAAEKAQIEETQRAVLNILEDFMIEQARVSAVQRAMLNILDDFSAEKNSLQETQKAVLNILEDFETEKNKVEAINHTLTKRTEELAWSNAELEQFAYVASHDLQEPLRMVSSFVMLLQKRYQGQIDDKADKYIYYAVDGAKRMQELIEGLLEYSRAGRSEIALVPVDLNEVLRRALTNLRRSIEESQAQVAAQPLPTVSGSVQQLISVFQNLISNAIKFHKPNSRPHIWITSRHAGAEWIISVKDDGIGMELAYSNKIFGIFQRLHTRTEYPGTGIGLAICKKVIERHGGRIWVNSKIGEGANFQFTLHATADQL
ncbi:MAG: GHKL domain-containing protein [Cyanobacteria bacterium NC_groundwater_1444_Ag_S-0.65um_54_12]|nr:GHKL domain-containing protein [Cyanobacteria bacterium NC_groundwater_1444_Ag_S-0.65um_54_12]